MKWLLILGATSDIARAFAHRFAADGFNLVLAARNPDALSSDTKDLKIRYGVEVKTVSFDALAMESHSAFFQSLNPMPDGVLSVVGTMEGNEDAMSDPEKLKAIMDTNFTGPAAFMTLAGAAFRKRGSGFIIGISSVAGKRPCRHRSQLNRAGSRKMFSVPSERENQLFILHGSGDGL